MNRQFAKLVESLAPKLDELLAREPLRYGSIAATLPMRAVSERAYSDDLALRLCVIVVARPIRRSRPSCGSLLPSMMAVSGSGRRRPRGFASAMTRIERC